MMTSRVLRGSRAAGGFRADPFGPRRRSRSHSRAPGRAARASRPRAPHWGAAPVTLGAHLRGARSGLQLGPQSRSSPPPPPPPRMPAAAPSPQCSSPAAGRPPGSRWKYRARTLALLAASHSEAQRGWEVAVSTQPVPASDLNQEASEAM